jgi:hypothetical protein
MATWEQFMEERRPCWDCRKTFKVKNLIWNMGNHCYCKTCAMKHSDYNPKKNKTPAEFDKEKKR